MSIQIVQTRRMHEVVRRSHAFHHPFIMGHVFRHLEIVAPSVRSLEAETGEPTSQPSVAQPSVDVKQFPPATRGEVSTVASSGLTFEQVVLDGF